MFVTVLEPLLKTLATRQLLVKKKIIGTAQDVFDHCVERLASVKAQTEGEEKIISKREFILVKDIKRDRPETNVSTVKGTRKLHAVRSTEHQYKLETRKLSCYCVNCLETADLCENINYCHHWEEHSLKLLKTTSNPSTVQNTEQLNMEVEQQENTMILNLMLIQYLKRENISNLVLLWQCYFQQREESLSMCVLDKF